MTYTFDAIEARRKIVKWIREWFEQNGEGCTAVVGISGGKDSTVVAALCVEALGADRVYGVMLPNGYQSDLADSKEVCAHLGIQSGIVNIRKAFNDILVRVVRLDKNSETWISPSDQAKMNLPPRLRMATLYTISQSINGRVANTCNLSETSIGWETKWGDAVGDFAPLANYTATEVVEIGLALNLPVKLVKKAPSDGLCGKTDEDAFGFSYAALDQWIRKGTSGDSAIDKKIKEMYTKSAFKRMPIQGCPGPVDK